MKQSIKRELNQAPMREWECRECHTKYEGWPSLCSACKQKEDDRIAAENARSLAYQRDHERKERAEKLARRRTEWKEFDSR